MAAPFLEDAFSGADGLTLTGYHPGWATVGTSGLVRLQNGRAYHAGSTTGVYYRSDAPAPSADYSVTADIICDTSTGTPSVGPCLRMSDTAQTMYQVRFFRGTGLQLARLVNSGSQTLDSTPFTLSVGESVRVKLEAKGSTLNVYVNGATTPTLTAIDTTITAPGFVGMRFATASVNMLYLDNLSAEIAGTAEATGITASLTATLDGATISSSALVSVAGDLSKGLAPMALASSAASAVKARMAAALAPATLDAAAVIEAELPAKEQIDAFLSAALAAATLSAAASPVVTGMLTSTLASPTLVATAKPAGAPSLDISEINPSRVVVFEGSGSKVVVFEGSGSRVVVFEGSGNRIRVNQMDLKVPIKVGEKWMVDRDRDEISFYGADITEELAHRNTVPDIAEVIALRHGVELLEGPDIQVGMVDGVQRTFVVVKLGPVEGALPEDWRWVARVPCANGERFDKTTWFKEVDP